MKSSLTTSFDLKPFLETWSHVVFLGLTLGSGTASTGEIMIIGRFTFLLHPRFTV